MMIDSKANVLLLIMILLLLVLVACSRSGNPSLNSTVSPDEPMVVSVPPAPSGDEEVVTITFACSEVMRPEFEKLADDFHAQAPDIRVQILAIEDLVDIFAGGSSFREMVQEQTCHIVSNADTALWNVAPGATQAGLLRDLTPFIERDATFGPDDFYPYMLQAFRWDDGTWALPSWAGLALIFYDKSAFDEAGVPYPHPGWTLDDFLTTAQRLTVREGDTVERYGFVELSSFGIEGFVVGKVVDQLRGEAGMPALDSPAVVDAVRWYTDLARVHEVMPPQRRGGTLWNYKRWLRTNGPQCGLMTLLTSNT